MFRGELLIDGYNLLHAAGLARASYGPGEFQRCRNRLLKLLASQLHQQELRRTTVVFDAPRQYLGPSPPKSVFGIRVLFADGPGEADDVIERLIRQSSAPRRMHVVSSDHRLQRAAQRRKAKFYDSEDFLARIARRPTLEERAARAEPPQKRHGLTSEREVDAWLDAFSDLDEELTAEDFAPSPPQNEPAPAETDPPGNCDSTARSSQRKRRRTTATDDLEFWQQRVEELWEGE